MTAEQTNEQAIVPYSEQTVTFYGDDIPVAQTEDGELFVPLRPLTQFLGLAVPGQRERVMRDPVMAARVRHLMMRSADGKRYSTLCLPLDLLPGWLFGITTSRVKSELQEKLTRYRAECFRVLWNAFKGDVMPAATSPRNISNLSTAEQNLEMVAALYRMAEFQVEIEQRVKDIEAKFVTTEDKREAMAAWLRDFIGDTRGRLRSVEGRVASLEMQFDSRPKITTAEAAEVALSVKSVAFVLAGAGVIGSYAKVYSALYRRFGVNAYENIQRDRYVEVMAWLKEWYDQLMSGEGPVDKE